MGKISWYRFGRFYFYWKYFILLEGDMYVIRGEKLYLILFYN